MWKFSVALIMTAAALSAQSAKYGVGRAASAEEIRGVGAIIAPGGGGLPEGSGTVAAGREVFAANCARCHGDKGQGDIGPQLVGGQGTLATAKPVKTVGSYWPYATTLWDYINRGMPLFKEGSLTPDEVYSITAYLLYKNGVLKSDSETLTEKTLPKLPMPNKDGAAMPHEWHKGTKPLENYP